jgi:hypothetical protein
MSEYIEYEVSRVNLGIIESEFRRRINASGPDGALVSEKQLEFGLWADKISFNLMPVYPIEYGEDICAITFLTRAMKPFDDKFTLSGFLNLKEGDIIRFPKEMPKECDYIKFDIVPHEKES